MLILLVSSDQWTLLGLVSPLVLYLKMTRQKLKVVDKMQSEHECESESFCLLLRQLELFLTIQ